MPIFTLLLAGLALAVAPPAPKSASPADVEDWVQHNLWPMGYFRVGTLNSGISYLLLRPDQDLRKPVVQVWVRYENYAPQTINGHTVRSLRFVYDVDCDGRRMRALSAEGFPDLNLQGAADVVHMDGAWLTPGSDTLNGQQIAYVCEAKARIVAGPATTAASSQPAPAAPAGGPTGPRSTSEADVEAWIAENLDLKGAYRFEYQPNAVVLLYVRQDLRPGEIAKVEARHEFFRPLQTGGRLVRSDSVSHEIDCDRGMGRLARVRTFPELNQKGDAAEQPLGEPQFSTPQAGTEPARIVALICREMREPGYALTVQKGPSQEPPPTSEGRVIPRRR
jgi:hypothetical protein